MIVTTEVVILQELWLDFEKNFQEVIINFSRNKILILLEFHLYQNLKIALLAFKN